MSASVARLLEKAPSHGPEVIAIDDVNEALDAVAARIGQARAERLWSEFVSSARNSGIVLVCATPGRFGEGGWRIPAATRLVRAAAPEELWKAGLTAGTRPAASANEAILLTGGTEGLDSPGGSVSVSGVDGAMTVAVPVRVEARDAAAIGGSRIIGTGGESASTTGGWRVIDAPGGAATDAAACSTVIPRAGRPRRGLVGGDRWEPILFDDDVPWVVITNCVDDDPSSAALLLESLGLGPLDGVSVVPSSSWHRFDRWYDRRVLALDPTADVLRTLVANARTCPVSLLAEQWSPESGVLVDQGRADRVAIIDSGR